MTLLRLLMRATAVTARAAAAIAPFVHTIAATIPIPLPSSTPSRADPDGRPVTLRQWADDLAALAILAVVMVVANDSLLDDLPIPASDFSHIKEDALSVAVSLGAFIRE